MSQPDSKLQRDREEREKARRYAEWEANKSRAMMRQPFLDDRVLSCGNPPICTLAAFLEPRLRKCPFRFDNLSYMDKIILEPDFVANIYDGGLDGYNWKVDFVGASGGPFVLKLFWDTEPPDPPFYYSAQRESQNVALLQQMQEALSPRNADRGPIRIFPLPECQPEADENLLAFSDERRAEQAQLERHAEYEEVTSMPRLRRCYGWMKIPYEQLMEKVPHRLWPPYLETSGRQRLFLPGREYTAIVYEYVEEGENVAATMQETIDFLFNAGFCHNGSALLRNWKSSILIDFSEFIHVRGNGWRNFNRLQARHVVESRAK